MTWANSVRSSKPVRSVAKERDKSRRKHIQRSQQNYYTKISNNTTTLQAAGQNSVKLYYEMFTVCIKITTNTLESIGTSAKKTQSFPATNNVHNNVRYNLLCISIFSRFIGRISGAIVAATCRSNRPLNNCPVYTLQAIVAATIALTVAATITPCIPLRPITDSVVVL